jgi:hypothetical protein
MSMEIIKSNKGKDLLAYDGYIYVLKKKQLPKYIGDVGIRLAMLVQPLRWIIQQIQKLSPMACTVTSDCLTYQCLENLK